MSTPMIEITTRSSMSVKPPQRARGAWRGPAGFMTFFGAARTTKSGRAAGAVAQAHARIDGSYGLRNPLRGVGSGDCGALVPR